jgi:luciferase family oxidoreductase group 1
MDLSILDFGYTGAAVDLMTEADRLGYRRYWLGEHHGGSQCANPLLLGALLAATSDGIRLGSGGVCLGYHSAYRIAEDARLVELLLPGRFDLGVTRGLTLRPEVRDALLDGCVAAPSRSHYEKLADLHGFLTGRLPDEHPLRGQRLHREPGPPMWVLGASVDAARWAAGHGTGFCFSLHHAPAGLDGPGIVGEYRRRFLPSPEFPAPAGIVVASMACAASASEARALAQSFDTATVVGTASACAAKLAEVACRFGVGEVMVLDLLSGVGEESLERIRALASQAGLTPRAAAAALAASG